MSQLNFAVFFGISSVLLEVLLRSIGLFLPLSICFVFYCAAFFPVWFGAVFASVLGMSLDYLFGYQVPWSALTFPAVSLLSHGWLMHVKSDLLLLHSGIGAFLGFLSLLPLTFPFFNSLHILVTTVIATALLLPFDILFLDMIRGQLGLELFSDLSLNAER